MRYPHRIVGGIVILITLFFLWRHAFPTFAKPSSIDNDVKLDIPQSQPQATRAYPPPPPSKVDSQSQQPVFNDVTTRPLRDRLRYYFPYTPSERFPTYIWQTWRTSPSSAAFENHLRPLEASWTSLHPGFIHEVITDEVAGSMIKYFFASVPEIWQAYDAMPVPVLKADFFRYLILLARGGVYTDIDTQALKPISDWLPSTLDRQSIGIVIGIEADPDREDWHDWYARRIQFCQWTIMAKPGHPILIDIVAHITETTLQLQSQGQLHIGKRPTTISIMEYTGPGVWTDTIFNYLNDRAYFDFSDPNAKNVTVSDFFGIKDSRRIGDVVVLPITSFSPGVGQMGAEDVKHPMAFVRHEFEGSWKPESEKKIVPAKSW